MFLAFGCVCPPIKSTFVGMAAFDVSGGTDDCQGVDASEAKEQREEAINLRGGRQRGGGVGTRETGERKRTEVEVRAEE